MIYKDAVLCQVLAFKERKRKHSISRTQFEGTNAKVYRKDGTP